MTGGRGKGTWMRGFSDTKHRRTHSIIARFRLQGAKRTFRGRKVEDSGRKRANATTGAPRPTRGEEGTHVRAVGIMVSINAERRHLREAPVVVTARISSPRSEETIIFSVRDVVARASMEAVKSGSCRLFAAYFCLLFCLCKYASCMEVVLSKSERVTILL